jgi:Glycosyltransferase family 87
MALTPQRVSGAVVICVAMVIVMGSAAGLADGLDYFTDAAFPIDALVRGDLQEFARNRAMMGDFSLFLRAPFVRLVFDQSLTVVYLVGAVPCLAAVVALAFCLRRWMRVLARPAGAILLVTLLAVLNPGVLRALHWGHPEEFLAGALCAGAVLAAARRHGLLAGVLLGLAIATKQWAVIAIIPTLLAASERRVAIVLAAGAIAVAMALPAVLLQPEAVVSTHEAMVVQGAATAVTAPATVWWLLSEPRTAAERAAGAPGFGAKIPTQIATLAHPLVVLIAIPAGWLFWRRRERLAPHDALGLLALLMLLRCVLDPWNIDYYHAPFLLALLAWEALARDGWPRITLFASVALALTFPASLDSMSAMSADALRYCMTYLVWALPLAGWLATALFAPQRLDRLRGVSQAWRERHLGRITSLALRP